MNKRLSEIEDAIAAGQMTAAQVFTQMRQLMPDDAEAVAWTWTEYDGIGGSPRTKYSDCPPGHVADAVPLYRQSASAPVTDAERASVPAADTVLIWSGQHNAYWRPGSCGYTTNKAEAGRYEREVAKRATSHCGPEKMIEFHSAAAASDEDVVVVDTSAERREKVIQWAKRWAAYHEQTGGPDSAAWFRDAAALIQRPAVPDGWQLMPLDPTHEMLCVIRDYDWPEDHDAGKLLQQKLGFDVIPPECNIETAAGQYLRLLTVAPKPGEVE